MKKRIIISNYDDIHNPYYAGGGARAVHQTALELGKAYAVTVITGAYPGSKQGRVAGVRYRRVGIAFGGPKLGQLLYQFVLPYYVMTEEYALWLESFTPPFSTGLLQLFTKKPVIGLVHMLSGEDMKRKYHLPFDRIEAIGLRTYRSFITTNDYIREKIAAVNPRASISVIPNGVELPERVQRSKKQHVLFLGRIEINQKGIDLFLLAVKQLKGKLAYPVVIAGGGEAKQIRLLHTMISELGLEDAVRLVGKVEGPEKQRLLNEAVCLVIPSRFETFSMVALEGMAAGVPIVSFQIPGLSWLPQEAGLKVPKFQTKAFAQAVLRETTILDKGRGARLQYLAQQYSWERIGKQYEQYVSAVLAR